MESFWANPVHNLFINILCSNELMIFLIKILPHREHYWDDKYISLRHKAIITLYDKSELNSRRFLRNITGP